MKKSGEQDRKLNAEYGAANMEISERFEFRAINPDDAAEINQAIEIERICFPPNEACSPESMRDRIAAASDYFLVAVDRNTGKIAGFLNGIATSETAFRDEFFTDASLHNPGGRVIMLEGLDVLPEYRRRGLARELMFQYIRNAGSDGKKMVVLTCLPDKIKMYSKLGFTDRGISASRWGGEEWHEMTCLLKDD